MQLKYPEASLSREISYTEKRRKQPRLSVLNAYYLLTLLRFKPLKKNRLDLKFYWGCKNKFIAKEVY